MTALLGAVFVASLLGSLHCFGMCGAFAAIAAGASRGRWLTLAAYNLGRLATYLLLGTTAGLIGAALNLGGQQFGLAHAAAFAAGALMIGGGIISLLQLSGVRIGGTRSIPVLGSLVAASRRMSLTLQPVARAALLGLATTWLPCGWLYAYVLAAAGTGSGLSGAALMLVFWTGTLPVLLAVGCGMQQLSSRLGRRLPAATAAAVVVIGVMTMIGRLDVAVPATAPQQTAAKALVVPAVPACCEAKTDAR